MDQIWSTFDYTWWLTDVEQPKRGLNNSSKMMLFPWCRPPEFFSIADKDDDSPPTSRYTCSMTETETGIPKHQKTESFPLSWGPLNFNTIPLGTAFTPGEAPWILECRRGVRKLIAARSMNGHWTSWAKVALPKRRPVRAKKSYSLDRLGIRENKNVRWVGIWLAAWTFQNFQKLVPGVAGFRRDPSILWPIQSSSNRGNTRFTNRTVALAFRIPCLLAGGAISQQSPTKTEPTDPSAQVGFLTSGDRSTSCKLVLLFSNDHMASKVFHPEKTDQFSLMLSIWPNTKQTVRCSNCLGLLVASSVASSECGETSSEVDSLGRTEVGVESSFDGQMVRFCMVFPKLHSCHKF